MVEYVEPLFSARSFRGASPLGVVRGGKCGLMHREARSLFCVVVGGLITASCTTRAEDRECSPIYI